ncbi:hypothetical protein STEG23_003253 [Scotinomys teguina]
MEYYAAEKNNGIMKFAGKWMELENVILSEKLIHGKHKLRVRFEIYNIYVQNRDCKNLLQNTDDEIIHQQCAKLLLLVCYLEKEKLACILSDVGTVHVGEDAEQEEHFSTVGGNADWYNHYGKQ